MKKNNKKKRIIWGVVIVIVLLILVSVWRRSSSDKMRVTSAKVERRSIVETVVANGKIQPETEVVISSEVSGKILELPFKEGAAVKKGELLVRINPDLAQASLDRAIAALNNAKAAKASADARLLQAEAQFDNNQTILDRNQKLNDQGAISQAEFDNINATFKSAKAEVMAARQNANAASYTIQSAQAGVKEASDSYSRTTIYAPMDGTISSLGVEVGEQVVGAMQMTGTEIMRIANLDIMEVLADVNESDIVRVANDDTVKIEVDAYLDRDFKGRVTEIANSAMSLGMSADQVTNFQVKIRILPDSYSDLSGGAMAPFRPGMNATVEVQTARKSDVLSVPIECITSRTDTASTGNVSSVQRIVGGTADNDAEPVTCVFIISGNEAKLIPVKTGLQDDKYIEVVSGLQEGQEVISGPFDVVSQKLMNGDEVQAVSKDDLYKGD